MSAYLEGEPKNIYKGSGNCIEYMFFEDAENNTRNLIIAYDRNEVESIIYLISNFHKSRVSFEESLRGVHPLVVRHNTTTIQLPNIKFLKVHYKVLRSTINPEANEENFYKRTVEIIQNKFPEYLL